MLKQISNIFYFLLEQTAEQKEKTFVVVAILALLGIWIVMDALAKSSFTGEKTYKKIWVFFGIFAIFLFVVLAIAFNKKN